MYIIGNATLTLAKMFVLFCFIYLVTNPFFSVAHVFSVIFTEFVACLRAVRIAVVLVFLGPVLAVTFTPFGLFFASHELVELVVMPLPFTILVSATMVFVPLATAVALPLLLVTLDLTPAINKLIKMHNRAGTISRAILMHSFSMNYG